MEAPAHTNGRTDEQPPYRMLKERILDGRIAPGERLLESRLSEQLGVSRVIIRESLARLQWERLVEPSGGRGFVVRSLSPQELGELYEMRLLLSGFAASKAATKITTQEIEQLVAVQDELERVESELDPDERSEARLQGIRRITELNNDFHGLIHEASRNKRLLELIGRVMNVPLVFRSFYWYSASELREAVLEHRAIIDALVARDGPTAERLMSDHITRGLNTLWREIGRG